VWPEVANDGMKGGSVDSTVDQEVPDTEAQPDGSPLSQGFRASQVAAGNQVAAAAQGLWDSGFSIKEARESWTEIRPQLVALLNKRQPVSRAAAMRFYNARRVQAGLPARRDTAPDTLADQGEIGKVIDGTGLYAFLHEVKGGAMMEDAFQSARSSLGSAAQRLVLKGGRDAILDLAKNDPDSVGWSRITGGTCDFCEELKRAGVVVGGDFPAHDDCQCTADPAFTSDGAGGGKISEPGPELDTEPEPDAGPIDFANVETPVELVSLLGSVTDSDSLEKAIQAASSVTATVVMRAKIRRMIMGLAKALGLESEIPSSWGKNGAGR
jgi:hypothetical protein